MTQQELLDAAATIAATRAKGAQATEAEALQASQLDAMIRAVEVGALVSIAASLAVIAAQPNP